MNSSPSDICAACHMPIGRDDLVVEVVDIFSGVPVIFHGRCTPTSPSNTLDRRPEEKLRERARRAVKRN